VIVVRGNEDYEEEDEDNESMDQAELAEFRRQRDALYRKALEAGSRRIGGAAAYYAAEARELNKEIRSRQQSMQMELFIQANKVQTRYRHMYCTGIIEYTNSSDTGIRIVVRGVADFSWKSYKTKVTIAFH
jgi:hypothetical protein